jgi:hypothetical protein
MQLPENLQIKSECEVTRYEMSVQDLKNLNQEFSVTGDQIEVKVPLIA